MQQSREIRQDPQTRLLLCIKLLNDRSNLSLMAQGFALPEDSIVQTREALPKVDVLHLADPNLGIFPKTDA